MRIEQISSLDQLPDIKDDWNNLNSNSKNNIFSKYNFVKNWLKIYENDCSMDIDLFIEYLFEKKYHKYDFMRGYLPYKTKYGVICSPNFKISG
jgi:hypothetical protein